MQPHQSPSRFILTGAPGSGKTAIIEELTARGMCTIREAATDVIAAHQASGNRQPWLGDGFLDEVAAMQRHRQQAADAGPRVQLYDRSPVCTLALARYLDRPVTAGLAAELDRIANQRTYCRQVFLVQPLGFITPTAARTISAAQALAFAALHERIYTQRGYRLTLVPPGTIAQRADLVAEQLAQWA